MHPQLERYRSTFLDLKEEVRTLAAEAPPEAFRTPPEPNAWSAAQCLDHLNTAGWLLVDAAEEKIQKGQRKGPYGEPPFEYGFVSRWFVRSMEPSPTWALPSPSVFEPLEANALDPEETIDDFLTLQDQLAECVVTSDGLDLRRLRLSSPALPILWISLGAWFEATAAHEKRHLDQARRALRVCFDFESDYESEN